MNRYLIETESTDRVFSMRVIEAPSYISAKSSITGVLRTTLIACNAKAPEYKDQCSRELVG